MTTSRRLPIVMLAVLLAGPLATQARAIPVLQLDILNGTYDSESKTIIAPGAAFTLYALLTPKDDKQGTISSLLARTYYLSVALTPRVEPPGASLGSFEFQGDIAGSQPDAGCAANLPCDVRVTEDMIYGTPPFETYTGEHNHDKGDLGGHEIYETYYIEFAFEFDPAKSSQPYDTKSSPGQGATGTGNAFYQEFQIDTSFLNPGYALHFDLYSSKLKSGSDVDIDAYAPFDRDAQSLFGSGLTPGGGGTGGDDLPPLPVAEPTSCVLLGTALAALGVTRRRAARTSGGGVERPVWSARAEGSDGARSGGR